MCSQGDDPTTYDAPEPTRPRTYRLSGDAPEPSSPTGFVPGMTVGNGANILVSPPSEADLEEARKSPFALGWRAGYDAALRAGAGDEYKEATDAAMNYGEGFAAARTLALATLGELLNEAENVALGKHMEYGDQAAFLGRLRALREARDRVAEAVL